MTVGYEGLLDINMIESYLDVVEAITQILNGYRELNDKEFITVAEVESKIGEQVDELLLRD